MNLPQIKITRHAHGAQTYIQTKYPYMLKRTFLNYCALCTSSVFSYCNILSVYFDLIHPLLILLTPPKSIPTPSQIYPPPLFVLPRYSWVCGNPRGLRKLQGSTSLTPSPISELTAGSSSARGGISSSLPVHADVLPGSLCLGSRNSRAFMCTIALACRETLPYGRLL